MSFEDELQKYLERPKIKKKMKAHYKSTGGGVSDITQVEFYAQHAIRIIVDSLPISLKAGPQAITYNDMTYSTPVMNNDGDYIVELKWNPKAIHRESLYRPGYPDGIENIVALHSTGYMAEKPVFGYWRGHHTNYNVTGTYGPYGGWAKSLQAREPDPFISFAVSMFNNTYRKNGVILTAPPIY